MDHSVSTARARGTWLIVLSAAGVLLVTTGVRQSLGLFIAPLDQVTGLGVLSISFALAVGQFVWGAVQPGFGALSDRYGAPRVLAMGCICLAAGVALASIARTQWALVVTLGLLSAIGAGAGSFSILIGATAAWIPPARQSFSIGVINAGASVGQAIFAPLIAFLLARMGTATALVAVGAISLVSLPMILGLRRPSSGNVAMPAPATVIPAPLGLGKQLAQALQDRSYWFLHASFFTCGLHVAFLVTHLPGEVALCGLPARVSANAIALIGLFNIAGSLAAGALGARYRMKSVLAMTYISRTVIIGLYLLSPRTTLTFYVFAAALGFSWLATVPPTAGIVGKLFGTRYLSTLFGLTLLSHQAGAFFGAWLGGLTRARFGDYHWMWIADMALATLAALTCLPIREPRPTPVAVLA
jgi:MFS family permease